MPLQDITHFLVPVFRVCEGYLANNTNYNGLHQSAQVNSERAISIRPRLAGGGGGRGLNHWTLVCTGRCSPFSTSGRCVEVKHLARGGRKYQSLGFLFLSSDQSLNPSNDDTYTPTVNLMQRLIIQKKSCIDGMCPWRCLLSARGVCIGAIDF